MNTHLVMVTLKEVVAVILLKLGAFRLAVSVTVQTPISEFDCELTEKLFAFGVAAGLDIVSQE